RGTAGGRATSGGMQPRHAERGRSTGHRVRVSCSLSMDGATRSTSIVVKRRAPSANQGGTIMNRTLSLLAAGACALAGLAAPAQAAPEMSLSRFECGTPQAPTAVNQRFSDIYAYGDLKLQFVYSCYLVKHGDDYLLWDTGHAMTAPNVAPKVS